MRQWILGQADHFFPITVDSGLCQYPQELTRESIYLTLMGRLPLRNSGSLDSPSSAPNQSD